jgi:hypothetical protein
VNPNQSEKVINSERYAEAAEKKNIKIKAANKAADSTYIFQKTKKGVL